MDGTIQIGEILDGKYEILEFLGAGGVGSVYKAKQVDTQRLVAIKVLHPAAYLDDEFKARFLREGKALSQLEHRAIVRVFHLSVSSSGLLYLVMEYISGRSLRHYLNEKGSIEPAEAIAITQELALALAQVHKLGLVHRDLKPENLLLDETQAEIQPKIVDFGLARIMGSEAEVQKLTQTGVLIGTCTYMSPEQCRAESVSNSSDIYSLSVCLYEFLCGRRPFDADTAVGIMYKHIHDEAAPLKVFNERSLDDRLGKILKRAMAKSPSDRYRSMEEFAAALSDLSDSLESGSQTLRLGKQGAALAVIVLLLLFLAGIGSALQFSKKLSAGRSGFDKNDESRPSKLLSLSFKDQMRHLQKLKQSGQIKESADTAYFLITKQKLKAEVKAELLSFHASCLTGLAKASDYAQILQAVRTGSNLASDAIACRSLSELAGLALESGLPRSALRLLDKLERLAESLGSDKIPAYSHLGIQKARILLQLGEKEESRRLLVQEFDRVSSMAALLVEPAIGLKELKSFEKWLESSINSPEELNLAAEYCLGAGLSDESERILNRASAMVQEYTHPSFKGTEEAQRRSRRIHDYLNALLSLSRAKLLLEKNKKEEALASLLQLSSSNFAFIELERPTQLRGDVALLLMYLGKEKQAWALHKAESRIVRLPNASELPALLSDLAESKATALKSAKELLANPDLPADLRILFSQKTEGLEIERAFNNAAAFNAILHKPINDPALELKCYLELAFSLRSRGLSRSAISVLSRSDNILERKFKNDDERKVAELLYADCAMLKARIFNDLGQKQAALRIFSQLDHGKLSDHCLFETAIALDNNERAWQILYRCQTGGDLILITHNCLRRGLSAPASLACKKARINLPSGDRYYGVKLSIAEISLLIEKAKLEEAAALLSRVDLRFLDSREQAATLEQLILLSALAESPGLANSFYKKLLECKTRCKTDGY